MNSKHGMGLLAAAGVAVGVIGITMGGASGAPTIACAPVDSGTSSSGAGAAANGSASGANANADANGTAATPVGTNGSTQNGAGTGTTGPMGPAGPAGPSGTDGSGDGFVMLPNLPDLPGLPSVPVPTLPGVPGTPSVPSLPSLPGTGSSGGSGHPFVDVRGNTSETNVDGATSVPPNDGQVVIQSDRLSRLLTLDGDLNLGR